MLAKAVKLANASRLTGVPSTAIIFWEYKVRMSTMVSADLELKSKPSCRKCIYVTSIPLLALVHDVLL